MYEYSNSELCHYGVPGMKWGVRKSRGRIGSAQRVRAKQDRIRGRLTRSSDKGLLRRNTINDYRRGRIGDLEAKARHREAKARYKALKKSGGDLKNAKRDIRQARGNRFVRNYLAVPIGATRKGRAARYSALGNDAVVAMLKAGLMYSAATSVVGGYSTGSYNYTGKNTAKLE